MAERYKVVARVISQKGTCEQGHKVGDEWVIEGKTPACMCLVASLSVLPIAVALEFGSSFPWWAEPGYETVACPDWKNPVVFELRRLPE